MNTEVECNMATVGRMAEMVTMTMESDLETKVDRLASEMEMTARRLTKAAQVLREEGPRAKINTLGEIQGNASNIDRMCGELGVLRDAAEQFARYTGTVRSLIASLENSKE